MDFDFSISIPKGGELEPTPVPPLPIDVRKAFPETCVMKIASVNDDGTFNLETPWGSTVSRVPCLDGQLASVLAVGMDARVRYSGVNKDDVMRRGDKLYVRGTFRATASTKKIYCPPGVIETSAHSALVNAVVLFRKQSDWDINPVYNPLNAPGKIYWDKGYVIGSGVTSLASPNSSSLKQTYIPPGNGRGLKSRKRPWGHDFRLHLRGSWRGNQPDQGHPGRHATRMVKSSVNYCRKGQHKRNDLLNSNLAPRA